MNRIPLVCGLTCIAILGCSEVYDFFITNDGVRFFAAQPSRLFEVGAIALLGGGLAMAYGWLPSGARQTVGLVVYGFIATCLTGAFCAFLFFIWTLASTITEAGLWGSVAGCGSIWVPLVTLSWIEFLLEWRRRCRRTQP